MEGDAPDAKAAAEEGKAQHEESEPAASASSESPPLNEDGTLLHLYESRLRRLRDYESRVFKKYNNTSSSNNNKSTAATEEEQHQHQHQVWYSAALEGPQARFEGFHQQRPRANVDSIPFTPPISRPNDKHEPPSVINVDTDEEHLDDITVSTGFDSTTTPRTEATDNVPKVEAAAESKVTLQSPAIPDVTPGEISSQLGATTLYEQPDVEGAAVSGESATADEGSHDESSTGGSSQDNDVKSENGEQYTVFSAFDSKYEIYSLMVDPDQDDRAVEIALYSAARPHMRAFHFAWLGFFVAFFNWFGITPLLSEVAHSLNLNRKQIWTSNTLAVASSAITRVMAGALNDIYGSRLLMAAPLFISAIPAIISGLVIQNATSLYVIRFLVGVAGCTFVTCQFWTSSMFTVEVAGTALSLVAGWGNLGGGVSQLVMGSILFPLFKVIYGGEGYSQSKSVYPSGDDAPTEVDYDRASDLAWRTILAIPGLMCLYVAYASVRYTDDCPKGNFRKRKKLGMMTAESPLYTLRRGACNRNTWLMAVQYSCCFGVELTMTSAAALYFQEEFGQTTESAAAIASLFGWMNLFARGLGGFASDMACAVYGIRGRLWVQVCCLVCEGALVCAFSITQSLAGAIIIMALFSIFVQAAEGSSYGIVPYIDYAVTGSISGIIGAGGNFGAVGFSLVFREYNNRTAFFFMGCMVLCSSILSVFIAIPGHRTLLCGQDAQEVADRRNFHAGQVGNVPNVEFHGHNRDNHRNRQSLLRTDAPLTPNSHHNAGATTEAELNSTERGDGLSSPSFQSIPPAGITSTSMITTHVHAS